jgi:hypothetical protein
MTSKVAIDIATNVDEKPLNYRSSSNWLDEVTCHWFAFTPTGSVTLGFVSKLLSPPGRGWVRG